MFQVVSHAFVTPQVHSADSPTVLLLGAVLLLVASGIHTSNARPPEYSWSRTLDLPWQAIIDAWFMVMASIVQLAASLPATHAETTTAPWLSLHFLFAGTQTDGIACVLLSASKSYTVRDCACMIPVVLFSELVWCPSIVAVLVLGWHDLFDVLGRGVLAGVVIAVIGYQRPSDSVQP